MRIYNTLTRRKEEFIPRDEGKVSIYACGPTVYNHIHIGNARTFLNFDVIRRYLQYAGYEVTFVQNITDVDDKIINQAREEKDSDDITPGDVAKVAEKYTRAFEKAMSDLRVEPPSIAPKATEHIDGMIELVGRLIEDGFAYEVDGDVYFEVRKFADYGKLSGRTLEDMRAGERVEIDERKRDPTDFALWKSAKSGEPSWDSPWGKGRPGWHIECSVMSTKYLGYGFDIHGGASDLIFPHHENEIAQSEAATGAKPFARNWMHCGLLNVNRQKMAKSLGNFTLLKDVLAQGYDADTVRMLMLGTHYRKPLDFSDAALDEARAKVHRIENCLRDVEWATHDVEASSLPDRPDLAAGVREGVERYENRFKAEMDDDFNTAGALGAVFALISNVNEYLGQRGGSLTRSEAAELVRASTTIKELTSVLGLDLTAQAPVGVREEHGAETPSVDRVTVDLPGGQAAVLNAAQYNTLAEYAQTSNVAVIDDRCVVTALLRARADARAAMNWGSSDAIRNKLAEIGLAVEDTPQGQRVTPISTRRPSVGS